MAPYSHEFVSGGHDSQMLSGIVSAMSSFMNEVTGVQESKWKTVYGSNSVLIVQAGEWMAGVLEVMRETSEMRSRLRRIVKEFEDSFPMFRDGDVFDGTIFEQFDRFVRRVFVDDRLSERSAILKGSDWSDIHGQYAHPSISFKVARLLHGLKSGQSIAEVAQSQGLPLEEVKNLVSEAVWQNVIHLKYVPADDDVLALSERSSSVILKQGNPMGISSAALRVLAHLDSRTPVYSLMRGVGSESVDRVLDELGNLIDEGYVQRIPLERRFVLLHECILSRFMAAIAKATGPARARSWWVTVCSKGTDQHPLLGRIHLTRDFRARCVIEDTMTPADLDNMYDALGYLINEIENQPSIARDLNRNLLQVAREHCRRTWGSYLMDTTL